MRRGGNDVSLLRARFPIQTFAVEPPPMNKRSFSSAERYAVWLHHEKRCWLCTEPLRFFETTVDHVLPESLLEVPDELAQLLAQYGLPTDFNINGFENWLPCHQHCNQRKGARMFRFVPENSFILQRLGALASSVERTARNVGTNAAKDKLIGSLSAALERQTISWDELQELLGQENQQPFEMIHLDSGYWLDKRDVARECDCQCERTQCVGADHKVHCYFSRYLSPWVIQTGLYWQCYDEIIVCPRCNGEHRRGHIGRDGRCGSPFRDQEQRTD